MKNAKMETDVNGKPSPVMELSGSQIVDGTSASAQSSAIDANMIRILSLDNILWIERGANPTALDDTSETPSVPCGALNEIWLPIVPGQKVAILGGKACISLAGR